MKRIAVDCDNVCKLSRFKTADCFPHTYQFGAYRGCRAQHFRWRKSKFQQHQKFICVFPLFVCSLGIVARRDLNVQLPCVRKFFSERFKASLQLIVRRSCGGFQGAELSSRGGHEVHAVLRHEGEGLVIHCGAMLYRVHARLHSIARAIARRGVGECSSHFASQFSDCD